MLALLETRKPRIVLLFFTVGKEHQREINQTVFFLELWPAASGAVHKWYRWRFWVMESGDKCTGKSLYWRSEVSF